tara:strand:+ start:342 stop:644 length:303 start_codon:yes stop_codon:yes gene_type:complete
MAVNYINQRQSSNIPSGLRPNDVSRVNSRTKNNLSIRTQKLYGRAPAKPPAPKTSLWQFNSSTGDSISNLAITFTGNVVISWGDGTKASLTSGQYQSHTY